MFAAILNALKKLFSFPKELDASASCHLCPFKDRCVAAHDDTPELPGEKHDKSFVK